MQWQRATAIETCALELLVEVGLPLGQVGTENLPKEKPVTGPILHKLMTRCGRLSPSPLIRCPVIRYMLNLNCNRLFRLLTADVKRVLPGAQA
jgi:hypothetical protein